MRAERLDGDAAMLRVLKRLRTCRRGATAIEYGLIVSLIVIAMIASFKLVANATVNKWDTINAAVTNAR
ncbi:MAG: Flp family type IVb pilin [Pseudomonadota bacterium]